MDNNKTPYDKLLKKLHSIAYTYALYKVGSLDVAEDIASQAIYSYLLKRDQISHENHEGWIYNTSKNYCNQYFELIKSERKLKTTLKIRLADEIQQRINETKNYAEQEKNTLLEAVNDVKASLSEKELKTYIFYLRCKRNIKQMHRASGESYSALRQRVSRINRKIKAETFQRMGVITTKKIITPQINIIILKFLQSFKEHLETNTLNKMFYYFSKKDISNYHPTFDIKEVLDYEVDLDDSIYTIHVVFTNKKNESESFYFTFTIENNALKVLQPPTPHKEHYQLIGEDAELLFTLLQKYPEDSTGMHNIPEEELAILRRLMGEEDE